MDYVSLKSSIDTFACDYYALNQQGADTTNVKHKLIEKIYEYLSHRHKFCSGYDMESDFDLLGVEEIFKIISQALSNWTPGNAAFSNYLFGICNKRMITALKKINREINNRDTAYFDEESDSEQEDYIDTFEDFSSDSDTEEKVQSQNELYSLFTLLNESILFKKKEYENSPKFCYPISFFTELVTRSVSELGIKKAEEDIPEKVLNVIDKDFAVVYLDAEAVGSFADIFRAELRPLSDFTMTEADRNEKCGYALKNVVYRKYVSTVKGKDVSDSAVSQQRKLFEQILGQIRREKLNR